MITSKKLIFLALMLQAFSFGSLSFAMERETPANSGQEAPTEESFRRGASAEERARHNAQEHANHEESRYKPNSNSDQPEINIGRNSKPHITVNNVRNPIFFSDNLHRAGADEGDENYAADREGELQAKKQAKFNQHFAELSATPEAKEQKVQAFRTQAQLAGAQKAAQLAYASSDEGRRITQAEIDHARDKREAMRKAIPLPQRIDEALEDARIEFEARKFVQEIAIQDKIANANREKKLAAHEAEIAAHKHYQMRQAIPLQTRKVESCEDAEAEVEAKKYAEELWANHKSHPAIQQRDVQLANQRGTINAATELATKLYLRNNDPDLTFRGRFTLLAQEAAIRLAIGTAIDLTKMGLQQGGSFLWSKGYEYYLRLPLSHSRNLKEQEEMLQAFKAAQAQKQMLEQEKTKIQTMLLADTKLLNDHWREIQRIKGLIAQAVDPKEKEQLKEAHDALTQNYVDSVLKKSAALQLNFNHLPQMNRLISASRQRQKQKEQKAAEQKERTRAA